MADNHLDIDINRELLNAEGVGACLNLLQTTVHSKNNEEEDDINYVSQYNPFKNTDNNYRNTFRDDQRWENRDDQRWENKRDNDKSSRHRSRSPRPSKDNICRDFLRNVCHRQKCRFYHPVKQEKKEAPSLIICIDFKNGCCNRKICRYLHLTNKDEDVFKKSGEIPSYCVDKVLGDLFFLEQVTTNNSKPVCKRYLENKSCFKKSCRYRHLSWNDFKQEVYEVLFQDFKKILGAPDCRTSSSSGFNRATHSDENYSRHDDFFDKNSQYDDDAHDNDIRTSSSMNNYRGYDNERNTPADFMMNTRSGSVDFMMNTINRPVEFNRLSTLDRAFQMSKQELEDAFVDLQEKTFNMQSKLSDRPSDNWNSEMAMEMNSLERENQYLRDNLQQVNEIAKKLRIENAKLEVRLQDAQSHTQNTASLKKTNDVLVDQINKIKIEMQRLESEVSSRWMALAPTISEQPTWVVMKTLINYSLSQAPDNYGNLNLASSSTDDTRMYYRS